MVTDRSGWYALSGRLPSGRRASLHLRLNLGDGSDERDFPTMPKLRKVLRDYAWKWMGPSVSQDGDPVARHVLRISWRRPVAYLLMQAFDKTSIAKQLFAPAGMRIVSRDQQIGMVAQGKLPAPEDLRRAIADGYSPWTLRPGVQKHLRLAPALVGRRLEVDLGGIDGKSIAGGLQVSGEDPSGPALQLVAGVEKRRASQ